VVRWFLLSVGRKEQVDHQPVLEVGEVMSVVSFRKAPNVLLKALQSGTARR